MKLFFSGERSISENIAMLKDYKARCLNELEELDKAMGNIERYRQIAEVNQDSVYWQTHRPFWNTAYQSLP